MLGIIQWFRQHLNWAMVLITVGAGLVGYLVISLTLFLTGFSHIPFPNSSNDFSFQAGVDVANAISLPCFGWILKQKNRSLWFISFFIPPFIPYPVASFTIIVLLPFWLIGFIITLLLNNKYIKLRHTFYS
jgi:hypothetical protein